MNRVAVTLKSKKENCFKTIKQPHIIEKTKLNQSLQPKQKKILVNSWAIDCYSVYFAG